MIRYFRKKPISVPMLEWTGENLDEIQQFTGRVPDDDGILLFRLINDIAKVYNTEETGWIPCPVGHHVVKGVRGEFYPISPAVLEQSYDEVTDEVTL